jgi:hypothetical protein
MLPTLQDQIEFVEAKLGRLILKAESGLDWAEICKIEDEELVPLLRARTEAARRSA